MGLLKRFIRNDLADLHKSNVRVRVIGSRDAPLRRHPLASGRGREPDRATTPGLTLVVAFNYGSRQEIAAGGRETGGRSCRRATRARRRRREAASAARLDTAAFPIPISSSGPRARQRLSNFLLWQAAYAEFVFTPVLWPDFDRAALEAAHRRVPLARAPLRRPVDRAGAGSS